MFRIWNIVVAMTIDANDLILFAQVIDAGGLSRAAARCGLPKSTLSRRLSQLEERLGERLLTRSTRRLALTEFGERMLEHARRLLEDMESAAAFAQHRQGAPRGLLRVSMPPDFVELDLAPFLLEFAGRYPEVRVELDLSPRRVDLLAERFDIAVRVANRLPDDATLIARQLCEFRNGLFASPAYLARYGRPLHPAELSAHVGLPLIGGNGDSVPWRLTRGDEHWEGLPPGALSANSLGLQREMAAHGMGIVGLAERFAEKWVAQGLLERLLPDWPLPSVTVWCITPGRRLLPTRTLAFIELLRERLGAPR